QSPSEETLTISGANWVRSPCRHLPTTRDILYEPTVYLCGESRRNCQVRLGAPSSPRDSRSHASNADSVLPIQYDARQAAPRRRALICCKSIFCTIPPSGGALAFRVTTTTPKPTCLLRRLQYTR